MNVGLHDVRELTTLFRRHLKLSQLVLSSIIHEHCRTKHRPCALMRSPAIHSNPQHTMVLHSVVIMQLNLAFAVNAGGIRISDLLLVSLIMPYKVWQYNQTKTPTNGSRQNKFRTSLNAKHHWMHTNDVCTILWMRPCLDPGFQCRLIDHTSLWSTVVSSFGDFESIPIKTNIFHCTKYRFECKAKIEIGVQCFHLGQSFGPTQRTQKDCTIEAELERKCMFTASAYRSTCLDFFLEWNDNKNKEMSVDKRSRVIKLE